MKNLVSLLTVLLLSGCASHKLSSNYAEFDSKVDQANPPLLVTSKFNTSMCSSYFGYIDFSIRNPSAEWKRLNNVRLEFPFGADEQFSVISGDKLVSWARAEERRQGRLNHNTKMAYLASGVLGGALIATGNKKQNSFGKALASASVVSASTKVVSNAQEKAENAQTEPSHHLMASDALIPPGMDNQYWLLLSMTDEAPLMAWITVTYDDEAGNAHTFTSELENWSSCDWQQKRKDYLDGLAHQMAYDATAVNFEKAVRADSLRGKLGQKDAFETELLLMKKKQLDQNERY